MGTARDTMRQLARSRCWLALLFFAIYYVYVWRILDPTLIYYGFGTTVRDVPLYSTGWRFFLDTFVLAGGPVLYLYGLASQGFYYPWLGAVIITATALVLCELTRRHSLRAGLSCLDVAYCFPAVLILWMYSRYDHPLAGCLTLVVGLALSYGVEVVPIRRASIRIAAFCLAAAMSYWLAGAGAVLVFALMTTIHLLVTRHQWLWALVPIPVSATIVWGLIEYVFVLSPRQAFLAMIPFWHEWTEGVQGPSTTLLVTLYGFVPVAILLMGLGKITLTAYQQRLEASHKKRKDKRPHRTSLALVRRIAGPALPVAILALGLWLTNDPMHREIVEMNALSRQGRWSDVLELARSLPKGAYNIYCNHDINRALYRNGRLGYDMLCFQQNPHALLLTHNPENSSVIQVKMCATFMELGNIDLAEKLASEFLVGEGRLGVVLEKLAWINLIKGRKETARVYLNVMAKDPICRGRARRMLDGLDKGFGPAETAYIDYLKACIPNCRDGRLSRKSVEEMLAGLLAQNSQNKMAFEYLMASYLLAGRLDGILANVERVRELGYSEIPTLYEEALLIHHGTERQRLDLKRYPVKHQTLERYKRFVQLDSSMNGPNSQAVFQQMLSEFGTSYFFYYRFAIAGQTANP